jgi:hypothetical protein
MQGGVNLADEFIEVIWDRPVAPAVDRDHELLVVEGGSRALCHSMGLKQWRNRNGGELPDVWFCVDDDIVPCRKMFERMEAVLAADEDIYLLGCWNDGSQRQHDNGGGWLGYQKPVAGEIVQYGVDFNVGGAVQAIPRRAIQEIGVYDPAMVWLEDHDYTQRVRAAGHEAAISLTTFAVVLEDDGVDPTYRQEMTDTFFAKRKEILGW